MDDSAPSGTPLTPKAGSSPNGAGPVGAGGEEGAGAGVAGKGQRSPADVTVLLGQVAKGQPGSADALLEAVYSQLHSLARQRMAGERSGHTLGATGLVHEAYAKLFCQESVPSFQDRAHFFRTAAQAMRRVLIDYARASKGLKRGGSGRSKGADVALAGAEEEQVRDGGGTSPAGGDSLGARLGPSHGAWRRVSLDGVDLSKEEDLDGLLSIDEAIDRLEQEDERAASVVRLRFYAGLELTAVAELLGITVRSVSRDWNFARAWMANHLQERDERGQG